LRERCFWLSFFAAFYEAILLPSKSGKRWIVTDLLEIADSDRIVAVECEVHVQV
jgi:hypothetical protein